ncbi:MAG: hypothetical protein ACKOSQ_09975, partial [Planctomycetaceae bacterium]
MAAPQDGSTSVPDSRIGSRIGSRSAVREARDDDTVISAAAPIGPSSSADIGRALEGTMLGPYRLDAFIGGGGMGAVFKALDTTLDRT